MLDNKIHNIELLLCAIAPSIKYEPVLKPLSVYVLTNNLLVRAATCVHVVRPRDTTGVSTHLR